jgi:hypothetical protein
MNFSAQGYAELTSILQPDIAVLEGGYSIEGALPYVNVGIILALAGLDYGNVHEPDYDPERIRQSSAVTDMIERTGEAVLALWEQRRDLQHQIRAKGGHPAHQRTRRIYYDTAGICEAQHETVQICDLCAGALRIESSADTGNRILAVCIPRNACPACGRQGERWYSEADLKKFDHLFLQDRRADEFTCKSER